MPIIMELQTVQTNPFRILTEGLKDILMETDIEFNEDSIKITTTNQTSSILVSLTLDGSKFSKYVCTERVVAGVNLLNFFRIIKTINKSETLILYYDSDDPNVLGIRIRNDDKKITKSYRLKLQDIDDDVFVIPDIEGSTVVSMASTDLQAICKEMRSYTETIEIECIGRQISFRCDSDATDLDVVIDESDNCVTFLEVKDPEEVIQAKYPLKLLVYFVKCTHLSINVDIHMKNRYPLFLIYKVGNMGTLKLGLSPNDPNNS